MVRFVMMPFFLLCNLCDLILTLFLIEKHNCNIEANPLAAYCFDLLGIFGMTGFKIAIIALTIGIAIYVGRKKWYYEAFIYCFGIAILLPVVALSVSLVY